MDTMQVLNRIARGSAVLASLVVATACGVEGSVTPVSVTTSDGGSKVEYEMKTGEGSVSMESDASAAKLDELGVPLPPGAKQRKGDSVFTMKLPTGTSRTATFTVASTVKEVEAFYEKQFTLEMSMVSDEGGTLMARPSEKRTVSIMIDGEVEDGRRAVTITVVDEK
jgi:hypothetical protein